MYPDYNEEYNNLFMDAVENENVTLIKEMIYKDMIDDNVIDYSLKIASMSGLTKSVLTLLLNGANDDYNNERSLILASKKRYIDIVELLLQYHQYTTKTLNICLMLAINNNDNLLIELIHNNGASLELYENEMSRNALRNGNSIFLNKVIQNEKKRINENFDKINDYVIWEPGNYYLDGIDESTKEHGIGEATRIDMSNRGIDDSIYYAKKICSIDESPFNSFSINPECSWITLKTKDGIPLPNHRWTTYIKNN